MNTLELTLQRKTDSGYPVIAALTRPGGFLPLRREGTLTLDIAALAESQYDPLAYGTALGQALFVDEIRDAFREGLASGEPLRVLLSIEAPDLRALDWHRLAAPFDGRWRCLASQQNTPFSLSIPSPASAHFPAIGSRDLRALVLVAGPESLSGDYKLAPFDFAATIASIQAALGDIPCDILPNPSLDALCAALTSTPYTFLHLVCHGAVKQETGETILFFPKDSKGGPTPATDLLNRLGSLARLPHFAFISACESALPQNGLGSLAGQLVRELGLPAVLAMTDRVSIATASAIAAPFYAHLYQHGQPDLALAQSLAGLQGAHDLTVPAIFSRLGDRPLFDDNTERTLTDKELEFGLAKLAEALPERAPVMDSLRDALTRRLRSTLGADSKSLSESSRTERKDALEKLNSLSLEALDLSFNALCLGQTPPAYDSRSPFRGLESFRPEDTPYFFGREALTKRLIQKLNEHNFLTVLGASGSGKSSLVMAGLIPALNIPYAIFRPGVEPLAELDKALQADPQLLVVDQFEELFTLSAREQRSDFISRLLEQIQKIWVVITLRADFLGEVAPFKSLKDEVQNHQEIIPPMDEAELRWAMEGQAGCAGLRFESDLSQQMLDDVSGEPGAMPLLQHALWTLWTHRHGHWLRADEYRSFGGVRQAIASTADAVYARCSEFEKERLRDIFLRLTRLDESADGRDTRRRVLLRDLIPAASVSAESTRSEPDATTLLIKQLADARLVVIAGDEVEVAHEALIRHWERLRAWLNDDRDNLRLREGVSDDARRWENAARDESLLNHRGPRLELALAMSKNPRYRLNPVEQAYLDGCVGLREKEFRAKEALNRRILAGLATGLVTALLLASFAIYQMLQANAKEKLARTRELAAQSQSLNLNNGPSMIQSGLLGVEAAKMGEDIEVDQALRRYLALAVSPEISVTYNSWVSSVAFSTDGQYVAASSGDKTVRVWDALTGREVVRMMHDDVVSSIAFSFDGRFIVSGSHDGTARVWEVLTGLEVARIRHENSVNSVAFSPNGKYVVSGSFDNTARVWETQTGHEVARIEHSSAVYSTTFSPDGKYVVSGSGDKTARIWEVLTGREVTRITHDDAINSVTFSPDGEYIVSGSDDGTARVWEVHNGHEVVRITHNGDINAVAFSPDGEYIVSGSFDKTAKVWEVRSGHEIARMMHDDYVYSVAFSSDGQYVISGSGDKTARVWKAITGREVARMTHDEGVSSVAFSPDGQYAVSGSWDNTMRVWQIQSNHEVASMVHDSFVFCFAFSPNGQYIVSGSHDGTARVWEILTGHEIARITHDEMAHQNSVISVAFSPDGKYIVSGSRDNTARVWEALSGREVARMTHNNYVNSVAFSPDGKYVVSASFDKTARVWEALTGHEVARMTHEDGIGAKSVAFSPDGKYVVSGSLDNTARVWEALTGHEVARITHDDIINAVAFSPNGEFVASGSNDKTTRVLDVVSGREVANIMHNAPIYSIAFSPDGKFIVSGSGDKTVRVWKIQNGQEVAHMAHDNEVSSVAFSPNGQYIVSGGSDGTVRVWEAYSGHAIARMTHDDKWIYFVAFSLDGQHVISGSNDFTLRVWNWNLETLVNETCHHLPRNFTRSEWQRFFPDEPYRATCSNLPIEPEPTIAP